ncbi:MAG: poly-beta-1,6 N-acetyl-D-glucosamine synthase [Deltaproteobacteria bacterium]|nr:poly-beta-1,6 N-acetyl-D-glucosamine synthase [Deltaproteobacteria bacterium]
MNFTIIDIMLGFAFYYPLFMAYLWLVGAIYFYFRWEFRKGFPDQPPVLKEYPLVSIIVPCFNESKQIIETIEVLEEIVYPSLEIIAVNDGSTDDTGAILDELVNRCPHLRVLHLATNQGKAMALRAASLTAKGEFLVCIDGDALLDKHAITWIMLHFDTGPRVGAVTGNPRIRTRSTLLGRIQVGEFSAILGLIKRAQRIYGRVFTVSGVVSAFRRTALHRVGYWSNDIMTEDIDISWRLQLNHWDIRFESRALCWILMPETIRGLWKQRLRWAIGGDQALLRYLPMVARWKSRRMWGVCLEYFISILWGYTVLAVVLLWILSFFFKLPDNIVVVSLIPTWPGMVLAMTCLIQFAVSMFLDRHYDQKLFRNYFSMVWYPVVFWIINWLTSVVAFPKTLIRPRGERARWVTVDRGIQDTDKQEEEPA